MTRCITALALAALIAALSAGCGDEGNPGNSSSATLSVEYGGSTQTINLADTAPVIFDEEQWAPLSDVADLATAGKALTSLIADFEASDGFRPGKRSNCKTLIPLAGDLLQRGYVHLVSRNVRWDDALNHPSCLNPKDLAKLILTDK